MDIDWEASKLQWIADARAAWFPRLMSDRRLLDAESLLDRFNLAVSAWTIRPDLSFREVINIGNELATAIALLDRLMHNDTLRYEPPILGTAKTIDFLVEAADGSRGWIDVKTVAPKWQDDDEGWRRFTEIAAEFESAKLVVSRQFGGAAIAGQLIKARWSFITRTLELEQKASAIPPAHAGKVWLFLCGDGSSWHMDDLEDFADFYRMDRFRPDDWAGKATARYMSDRGLVFSRVLSGFHYLGRRHDEVEAHVRLGVRGPTQFEP